MLKCWGSKENWLCRTKLNQLDVYKRTEGRTTILKPPDKKYGTPRNSTQPSRVHYSAVVSGASKWDQVLRCDHSE